VIPLLTSESPVECVGDSCAEREQPDRPQHTAHLLTVLPQAFVLLQMGYLQSLLRVQTICSALRVADSQFVSRDTNELQLSGILTVDAIVIILLILESALLPLFLISLLGKHRRNISQRDISFAALLALFLKLIDLLVGITGDGSLFARLRWWRLVSTGGRQRKSTFGFRVFQHGNICGRTR